MCDQMFKEWLEENNFENKRIYRFDSKFIWTTL